MAAVSLSPAQQKRTDAPRRERRPSPIASNIFLGDWYDYYNRAIRRINSGDFAGAKSDLSEAIKLRPDDDPNARTYGVRFQEYYPNLELGILLYEEGKYAEALGRLTASQKAAPLEETRFFLHETQRQVALAKGSDREMPRLVLTEPLPGLMTNQNSVKVRGKAGDDIYVDEVLVNHESVLIPKARSGVEFEWEVSLKEGLNRIPVAVRDLVGRSQELVAEVTVDRQGPVFSLRKLEMVGGDDRAHLVGTVYDPHEIGEIRLNAQTFATQRQVRVEIDTEVDLSPERKNVHLLLADGFGNQTVAELDPRIKVGDAGKKLETIRVAALGFDPRWLTSLPAQGPGIDLFDLKSGQKVFLEEIYIDARVTDDDGIEGVWFQEDPVALPHPGDKDVIFSHLAGPMTEGTHTFQIKAQDTLKDLSHTDLSLLCSLPKTPRGPERLTVTVPPFDCLVEGSDSDFPALLRSSIRDQLQERGRFQVTESEELVAVFVERKLGTSESVDSRYRVADRALVAADLVIDAQIIERENTVSLIAGIVRVQDGVFEGSIEVHNPDKSTKARYSLAREFVLRLESKYPVARGEIFTLSPRILSTLSAAERVRPNTQVIAYRKGEEVILPSGKSVGADFFDIGKMLVTRVLDEYSEVQPEGDLVGEPVVGDVLVVR